MKICKDEMMQDLKSQGILFSHMTLSTEGDYTRDDGIWNYKDATVHIPHIHSLVRNYPVLVEDEVVGSVFLQRVLGLRFPLIVLDLASGPYGQTSFTTFFLFILIIENHCEDLGPLRSRVTTTYHVGTPRWLSWTGPIIQWILKRNYRNLTSTDIPMRERKGQLRKWGYQILSDDSNRYTPRLNINEANIIPAEPPIPWKAELNMADHPEEILLGRNDHLGLRVVRSDGHLRFYPRMCPHEGASLDLASCHENRVHCPWHGRKFAPVLTMELGESDQEISLQNHAIQYSQGRLQIETVDA